MANMVLLKSGGTHVGSPPMARNRETLRCLGVEASATGRGTLLQSGAEVAAAAAIGESAISES